MEARLEEWLQKRAFPTLEEFEATREMARRAREENEALKERVLALEAQVVALIPSNERPSGTAENRDPLIEESSSFDTDDDTPLREGSESS